MRSSLLAMVAAAALAWVPACKKEEKPAEETPAAEETATPTEAPEQPTEPEPAEPEQPDMANKMAHCPSAVEGAKTEVTEGEGAAIVTVTAGDEAAVAEIRTRAAHVAKVGAVEADTVEHTGEGTGGGALGKCPTVMANVEITAEDVEGGSKITVTPKDAAQLAEVVKTATDRAAALAGDGGHEHGSGMGGGAGAGTGGNEGGADKAAEGGETAGE